MAAMNVWPTDALAGSVSTEARWRAMARLWAPNGIAPGIGNEMTPSLSIPTLTVQAGACWVDGHYCELTAPATLTVTNTGLAVVRFDPATNSAELLWRDGVTTPTQNPVSVWELPIYKMSGGVGQDMRINGTLVSMGIPHFPNATVRASQLPTPYLNQLTTLDNRPGVIQIWNGSSWRDLGVKALSSYPDDATRAANYSPNFGDVTVLTTRPYAPQYWTGAAWEDIAPYVQSGSSVTTTNANGGAGIVFPSTMPGVGNTVMVAGDTAHLYRLQLIDNQQSGGASGFVALNEFSAPLANTVIRVNWITHGPRV